MQKPQRTAAIGFIFITLLIDITGWGIIIPVIPGLIEELTGGGVSEAAQYGGWLSFAFAITQFCFAPIMGGLSDKYGRRPVLLMSLFGFACDYLLLSLAPTIFWLFIGRILAGVTGASITTASAYIADVSTDDTRAKNFGLVGAAFGLGFIIGPVIGGLLGQYGTRVPFYAAGILCLFNFLYGYFILPESLLPHERRSFSWRRANPIGSLLGLRQYPKIIGLVLSMVLLYIGGHALQSNWTFYTMYRFGWSERLVGISLGIVGLLAALVQGGLVRWLNPKLGNERSIYVGLIMYSFGMLLFAFASETWMMLAFLVPYALGGIAGPALQATISSSVQKREQGQLQGALTSLVSATSIVGPPLMTNTFYYFTHDDAPIQFAGAPFLLASVLMLVAAALAYRSFMRSASLGLDGT